jgi:hypothetical protein
MPFVVVEEVKSVLTINKALRAGKTVFCEIDGLTARERVIQAKACPHLVKREVLTAHGWKHPTRVWIETPSATAQPELLFEVGAAAGGVK